MCITAIVFAACVIAVARGSRELELKDGPCPQPATLPDFQPKDFEGTWFGVYTQFPLEMTRDCMQNIVTIDGDKFYITSRFMSDSEVQSGQSRSSPIPGKPGVYSLENQYPNGTWVDGGWLYSFVGKDGNSNLDFCCQNNGNQHYEFYRIRSRACHISRHVLERFEKIARKYNNTDEFVKIKQAGCHFGSTTPIIPTQ